MIQTVDLYKSFGDLEVLKGINEHVDEGEVVSIIGPSGGGKSTFLRCLNMLEKPDSGQIFSRESTLPQTRWTLTFTGRKWAWFFSILTFFRTLRFFRT